jgi:hypothetical protein
MDHLPGDNDSGLQLQDLSQNKDWANGQPGYAWDWDCLTVHTFVPCPQFFVYLNLQLMSVPWRWLKMSSVLALPLPTACPEQCNKPPFSAFTMHPWHVGASGWTWHVSPRGLGLGSETLASVDVWSNFMNTDHAGKINFVPQPNLHLWQNLP